MTADVPPDALGFTDALVQLSFAVQSALADIGDGLGLTVTQMRLLGVLRDRRLKMQEIATVLRLEKSSATGLVDRAERRGLLVRGHSQDDGRSVLVTLSPAGRRHIATIAGTVEAALLDLARDLTDEEREDLARLAERILGQDR